MYHHFDIFIPMNQNSSGQSHNQLQAACFKTACQAYHPFLYRRLIMIPNDAARENKRLAAQLQALGLTPGVWDMCLHWFEELENPEGSYCAGSLFPAIHWFEFKVGSDDLSDAQKEFRNIFLPLGHKFYIIREEEEFKSILKSIVEPKLHIAKQIWGEGKM